MTRVSNLPALHPAVGVVSHSRGQIKHLILAAGARLHPQRSFELLELLTSKPFFSLPLSYTCETWLVRLMQCPGHWCEQNDDTAISIIAVPCAYVIIKDFYGVCKGTVNAGQDSSAGGASHRKDPTCYTCNERVQFKSATSTISIWKIPA